MLSLPRQVGVRAFRKEQWKDGIVNNPRQGASKMLKVAESESLPRFAEESRAAVYIGYLGTVRSGIASWKRPRLIFRESRLLSLRLQRVELSPSQIEITNAQKRLFARLYARLCQCSELFI